MATSQPLVPTGQAYGDRQETVGLMQQAGIPLSPSAPDSAAPAPVGPGAVSQAPQGPPAEQGGFSPLDMLAQNGPEAFPFIGADPEAQPSSQPDSPLAGLAASAQSSFALAVVARLQQSRGR